MKISICAIFPLIWSLCGAVPLGNGMMIESSTQEITPAFPNTQRRIIDPDSESDPQVLNILKGSNLDLHSLRAMQAEFQNKSSIKSERNRYEVMPSTFSPLATEQEMVESIILNKIKTMLEPTLRRPYTSTKETDEQSDGIEFDYTFLAVCEVPRHINLSVWFETNSWNILFKPNYRQFNVKSVFLRIYKLSDKSKSSNECDPDMSPLWTLTVSIYSRRRKELKRKVIYSQLITSNSQGWIEIDIKSTLRFWDHQNKNYGLAIDVYDQDEKHLDAHDYFAMQSCEAGIAIPWRAYKLIAEQTLRKSEVTEDIVDSFKRLYTSPRLDLISSSQADYTIESAEQQTRKQRHIRHGSHHHQHNQLHNFNIVDLKHKLHKHIVEHSHRGEGSVEET